MVGRLASAKVATDLGYGIEADPGPTGKLGHWKISGIPDAALAVHSKRAAEINQAVHERGFSNYQARQVAARDTRSPRRPATGLTRPHPFLPQLLYSLPIRRHNGRDGCRRCVRRAPQAQAGG